MITIRVNGREYTINKDFSVSDGPAREYIEHCVEIIRSDYRLWMGFLEPYLYANLAKYKSITPVALNYEMPTEKGVIY